MSAQPDSATTASTPASPSLDGIAPDIAQVGGRPTRSFPYARLGLALVGLVGWWLVYRNLAPASRWLTYQVFGLERDSALGSAVEFFLYDTPKVLLLLVLVVFGVGVVRTFFTPARTRRLLAGRRESAGNVFAALLGTVTPFCSCSAVPLFIGFVTAGVPLGVTFSFLISAPLVNEVALVLLFGMFGWKVAALYLGMGLLVAIAAGWTLGRLKLERHVEPWVFENLSGTGASGGDDGAPIAWSDRVRAGVTAVREIVGKVWIYVLLGIAVGAGIHGYVPENLMASIMGRDAWWSVPLAVLLGVPMYTNAAGVIPVVQALLGKGAALGTVLAFMMAVIGLSLPEAIILRQVLKPRLIAAFFGVVASGILLVGYLFNALL
ncbi:permease [Opitutus terrae]|uniref:Permease n=1 Tax=Opitutus terrae (strain DSM 11246 / JCM 15787 / PB90-1) TaxID=452637 RepID=B2A000_OPITP|nr:permease [Opitutus terrae]ACB77336.1 permease [Opitutus terrae PB90-1]